VEIRVAIDHHYGDSSGIFAFKNVLNLNLHQKILVSSVVHRERTVDVENCLLNESMFVKGHWMARLICNHYKKDRDSPAVKTICRKPVVLYWKDKQKTVLIKVEHDIATCEDHVDIWNHCPRHNPIFGTMITQTY